MQLSSSSPEQKSPFAEPMTYMLSFIKTNVTSQGQVEGIEMQKFRSHVAFLAESNDKNERMYGI